MSFGYRKTQAYTDVVDLYAPTLGAIDPSTNELSDLTYSASADYEDVKCHWEPKPEASQPGAPGRTNQDIIITTDKFHFDQDRPQTVNTSALWPLGDGWIIQLLTPGHPEYGSWYKIIGAPETHNWRAKKLTVLAKKSNKPIFS